MPGWMHHGWWGQGGSEEMRARRERHWMFMHGSIPNAYRGARSDITVDSAAIEDGGTLFNKNCASCHGKTGDGDGDAGKSLSPSPALLSFLIERPIAVDPYLLWSISEGGERFGTAMPAFKDELSREDIWKIVAYMRAGFPSTDSKK